MNNKHTEENSFQIEELFQEIFNDEIARDSATYVL